MKSRIISFLRANEYNLCLEKASIYFSAISDKDKHNIRINKFNEIWHDAYSNIPFYSELKVKNSLPNEINSLTELDNWPIVTKKDLQSNYDKLNRKEFPKRHILTGGSTGEPLQLGSYNGFATSTNQWIGRAILEINPSSKVFLIWGHQHLYGKGLIKKVNIFKRRIFDFVMNFKRVQGYDLTDSQLKLNFKKLLSYKPKLLIGFSPTILALCRANYHDKLSASNLNLKGVICTAGPLNKGERKEISDFFKCELIMEYGSAECGVMAYTTGTQSDYNIFWDTHLFQFEKDALGYNKNIVTRLTKEYVPLIRYDIGDYLELVDEVNSVPLRVKNIIGRPSDVIEFPNGAKIFCALINDAAKQIKKVRAVQSIITGYKMEINVLSNSKLTVMEKNKIVNRCISVAKDLKDIEIVIEEKDNLIATKGGKIPLVINK